MKGKTIIASIIATMTTVYVGGGQAAVIEEGNIWTNKYECVSPDDSLVVTGGVGHSNINISVKDMTVGSGSNGFNVYGKVDVKTSGNLEIENTTSNGIFIASDGTGTFSADVGGDLIVSSEKGWGIHNENVGVINLTVGGSVKIDTPNGITNNAGGLISIASDSIEVNANEYYGVIALGSGGIELNAENDVRIVYNGTSQSGGAIVNKSGDVNISAKGNTVIEGNINHRSGGTASVNVDFDGAGSYFKGAVKTDGEGTTNLSFNDGASWTVTGQSAVSTLEASNALIDMSGTDENIEVGELSGQGATVLMNAANSNTLTAATSTIQTLTARATENADNVTVEQAEKMLERLSAESSNKTVVVDEGMYNGSIFVDAEGNAVQKSNTLMQASLDMAGVTTLSINRILMNDVRKRLGDVRSAKDLNGAWARWDGGRLSGASVENTFNTIQVGADASLIDGSFRVGAAASYTNGDAEYVRGQADMDAYSFALYGTWIDESGLYADVVARYTDVSTDMSVDRSTTGDINNQAWSISGELGWRFDLADFLYVEPQVEGAYTYITDDQINFSDGSSYRLGSMDSLIGRVGVASGLKFPNNKGNVFLHVSAVHEFLGDAEIVGANGTQIKVNGSDTWVEYGLGANYSLGSSAYFWADVERTSGATLDEDWRATVGVRYNF